MFVSAMLNIVRKACMIAFPLISFSYASRVLGTEGMGIYEFSLSIVNYFALIAALGVTNYAVRDGAHLIGQHNQEHAQGVKVSKLDDFASEIFSINLIMTFVSYALMIIVVECIPFISGYRIAIYISGLSILFTTLSVDWINSLFEDYLYLTLRYIVVQTIAIIMLLAMVKTPEDIYKYITISIFAGVVNGVLNFVYVRRYVNIRFTLKIKLKQHAVPIFVLFCNNIASVVYLNSDVTILGLLTDDHNVGLYGAASKVYTMIKELINAAIFVTIPRFSMYVAQSDNSADDTRYIEGLKSLLTPLFTILTPACVGLVFMASNVICIVGGNAFLDGAAALKILAVAMFFAVLACFLAFAIVMPHKLEKYFLCATSLAAVINIVLNFIMIPVVGMPAAAITTLIAEIMVFIFLGIVSYKKVRLSELLAGRDIISVCLGSLVVAIVCSIIGRMELQYVAAGGIKLILFTLVNVVISVAAYMIVLIVMNNSTIKMLAGVVKKK